MSENFRRWQKKVVPKLRSLLAYGPRLVWKRYQTRRDHLIFRKQADVQAAGFFSQFGQDQYAAETLFPAKRDGFFVDIGANDGVTGSNSCYFERVRGWRGICIEPIPEVFAQLKENRGCSLVCGCIAEEKGVAKFVRVTGPCEVLSGLEVHSPPEHRARVRDEVARLGGEITELDVPCLRFNDLITEHGVAQIDYLSIDTEGSELEILRTIDFQACRIQVLDIENNYHGDELIGLLDPLGYELVAMVGCDEIYVHRDSQVYAQLRAC